MLNELTSFLTYRVRHYDDCLISFYCTDKRKANALIAAGRLDDDAVLIDLSVFFGLLDHTQSRTRLDGASDFKSLKLNEYFGKARLYHAVKSYKRGISNGIQYRIADHLRSS